MWNTANVKSFRALPIKKAHIETIIASWEDLYNIPQDLLKNMIMVNGIGFNIKVFKEKKDNYLTLK